MCIALLSWGFIGTCGSNCSVCTEVYRGTSPELEAAFGHKGPFWGRHYFFWREGAPLTLIYEVFSPQLEAYLGPMAPVSSVNVPVSTADAAVPDSAEGDTAGV